MIPDEVNLSFIPNDLLQSWAQAAQAGLSRLLQTPGFARNAGDRRAQLFYRWCLAMTSQRKGGAPPSGEKSAAQSLPPVVAPALGFPALFSLL
jgi:hypothetical protein